MSRIRFDQLAKQYLEDFLEPLGEIQRNLEVPGEPKFVDIWFTPIIPTPEPSIDLGLLNFIATTPCLIEPFHNAPTRHDIRTCLLKLLWVQEDQRRRAEQNQTALLEKNLPKLWILAATTTQPILHELGGQLPANGVAGIYVAPALYRLVVIAIDKLPSTEETLWLRILGRGQVQQRAIAELLALPQTDQRRSRALQLLTSWRVTLELSEPRDDEEGELMATLSQAYLEWEQVRIQQGIQQGVQQGEQLLVLRQLTRRMGALPERVSWLINQLPLSQLEALGEALLDFTTRADLVGWLLACRLGALPESVRSRITNLTSTQLESLGDALPSFVTLANLEHWLETTTQEAAQEASEKN